MGKLPAVCAYILPIAAYFSIFETIEGYLQRERNVSRQQKAKSRGSAGNFLANLGKK